MLRSRSEVEFGGCGWLRPLRPDLRGRGCFENYGVTTARKVADWLLANIQDLIPDRVTIASVVVVATSDADPRVGVGDVPRCTGGPAGRDAAPAAGAAAASDVARMQDAFLNLTSDRRELAHLAFVACLEEYDPTRVVPRDSQGRPVYNPLLDENCRGYVRRVFDALPGALGTSGQ